MDAQHKRTKPEDFPRKDKKACEDKAVAIPVRLIWPGYSVLIIDPKGKNAAVNLRRRPHIHIFDPFIYDPLREEKSC